MFGVPSMYRTSRLLPALFVLLTGCASIPPSVRALPETAGAIELDDTPFYPQERFQCGPAALTTVLIASGVETTLDDVSGQVYLPQRQGSLQSELLAASRAAERLPYVLPPGLSSIGDELAAGRPVCIFPEGAITRDGKLQPFRGGVEQILARRPVPVVPVPLIVTSAL